MCLQSVSLALCDTGLSKGPNVRSVELGVLFHSSKAPSAEQRVDLIAAEAPGTCARVEQCRAGWGKGLFLAGILCVVESRTELVYSELRFVMTEATPD